MSTSLDVPRAEFVALAAERPCVVRVAADLDVDVEPLAAYAALTGRRTATDTDGDADDDADADTSTYTFLLESAEKVTSSDPDGAFTPGRDETAGLADAGRHARYSFVGYDPAAVVTVPGDGPTDVETLDPRYEGLVEPDGGDVLDTLRTALPDVERRGFSTNERQQLDGGLVGFLAYDAVYDLWLDEVGVERPESRFPDAQFVLNTKTVVFDDAPVAGSGGDGMTAPSRGTGVSLICTPVIREDEDAGAVYDDLRAEAECVEAVLDSAGPVETGGFRRASATAGPREEYERAVRRAKEHVLDGDIYQGVVSRTRELYGEVDPLGLYDALREVNPSPYMYVLGYDGVTVVGASPETLVSVRGREVTANPIAGTCDRGSSPVEDRRLAGEMLADEKERAEHTMLVDLARNDVRRVSESGSIRVEEFMDVLKYSHVQHIESTVTGRLAPDRDAFDATRAAFPAGTLSGAPKIRAMELIDALEQRPRGLYGGGVGYYSWTGDADFAIVIRTATVEHGTSRRSAELVHGMSRRTAESVHGTSRRPIDRITVQAGAGIVADSDPAREYAETEQKMGGVLDALERIERGPRDEAEATR